MQSIINENRGCSQRKVDTKQIKREKHKLMVWLVLVVHLMLVIGRNCVFWKQEEMIFLLVLAFGRFGGFVGFFPPPLCNNNWWSGSILLDVPRSLHNMISFLLSSYGFRTWRCIRNICNTRDCWWMFEFWILWIVSFWLGWHGVLLVEGGSFWKL